MKYDPITKVLHVCVALGVLLQMITSLVMIHPKPGRLSNQWYEVHEWVGIGLLGIVSIHWLWALGRTLVRGEALLLFPWFSWTRLGQLGRDLAETSREALRGRLPAGDEPRALPAAMQGAGLLLALCMAATGTALAVGMAPDGGLSPLLRVVKEVHEALAPVMWAYLLVHPLLGVLHQIAGHRSLSRMFGLR
jgi:cytochrome b561